MAAHSSRKGQNAHDIFHILMCVNIYGCMSLSVVAVESHGQAFIQTDNELRYMVDGIPLHVIPGQNLQDLSLQETLSATVGFEPPLLDFQEQAVGMPQMEQVTVLNPDHQNSLHLLSISGSTTHFHCSFFQDKLVPPGGNTTFEVVFLARQIGNVENTLYIHTSRGSYKYQVFGVGVANPYRIRPFLEAKIPLNYSFSPLIHLHNPHGSILQVEEVYTSGGDLHLELPTGEKETTKDFWEIPPYETKPIMKASFVGRIENNHTAFIRIKTNKEKKDKILILPVEVEVTSAPGIYSPLEMLDFGLLRTFDLQKTLKLNLINSGQEQVYITNVTVSPRNSAINIEFRPVQLAPNLHIPTQVALISFTASKVSQHTQWNGKIIVHSKKNVSHLAIPFQATMLYGSLVFDRNKTLFYMGDIKHTNITRTLHIMNTFNCTIVIYNVTVPADAKNYITVRLNGPVSLPAQKTMSPFTVTVHPHVSLLHFNTKISLHTNASVFHIPIYVYNGRLKVVHHRPEIFKGQLDFGTLGVEEKRSMTFTLRNDNPVNIVVREFGANMDKTLVDFLGIEKGNGTTLTRRHNTSEWETNPLVLKPFHYAVFSVDLVAPEQEGTFAAEVIIVTQFENLYIPMTLRTADGSLNAIPEKVALEKCFPGKLSSRDLKIHSSFNQYMEVRAITFSPNDTRFFYVSPQQRAVVLEPNRDNLIGKIYFDPKRECEEDCYVGLPTYIPAGHHWLLGSVLDSEVADTDQYLYTRFRQKWDYLGLSQTSTINVTIQLDTNQVRGFLFPAQAHLHWPSLARKTKIKFPLTQVGNISVSDFVVENPGDVPVVMQILPLPLYPHPQTALDMVSDSVAADLKDQYIEMNELDIFVLPDLEDINLSANSPVSRMRKSIQHTLGVRPHHKTIAMTVPAGSKIRVRVGFQPKDDFPRTTLILIRNNMTILDTVVVQGQGGRGEMKFGNKKSGLLFDMIEKHLKSCDKKKQTKSSPPNFTVKRTFTARNTGQLPFYVHSFTINDSPCEGYGFKVLGCQGFELQPNSSKKIDIVFTPDFTMSRIRRTLTLQTSLGPPINFSLQATVPVSMLTKCAAALPRPSWEPILYYSSMCIMGFLLFCILVAAYFEADRIFTADIIKRRSKVCSATQTFDKGKILDLKAIAGYKQEMPNRVFPITDASSDQVNGCKEALEVSHLGPNPRRRNEPGISWLSLLRRTLFWQKVPLRPGTGHCTEQHEPDRRDGSMSGYLPDSNSVTSLTSQAHQAIKDNRKSDLDTWSPFNMVSSLWSGFSRKKYSKAAEHQHADLICNVLDTHDSMDIEHLKVGQEISHPFSCNILRIKKSEADENVGSHDQEKKKECNDLMLNEPHDSSPYINIVDEDADDDFLPGKIEEKRRALRKMKLDYSFKRVKEFKANESSEKDETSSSTTESSSLDQEEKTFATYDPTAELQLTRTRKIKIKSKKDRESRAPSADHAHVEEEFTVTSKSKAHTKIRVDPKTAFGGSIHEPSSLELPYTIKADSFINKELKRDSISPPNHTSDRKKTKSVKANKTKGSKCFQPLRVQCDLSGLHSLCSESPPPSWDTPVPHYDVCDLSELALQTEAFAKSQNKAPHGINEALSSSSRSSSYSSIVSNNSSNETLTKKFGSTNSSSQADQKKTPTPTNSLHMHPVIMGGKSACGTKQMTTPGSGKKNPWNQSPGTHTPPENMSSTFGLHPIRESHCGLGADSSAPTNMPSSNTLFRLQENLGQIANFSALPAPGFDEQPVTMMQKLMADRRKRQIEYQQKILSGKDWPGFDLQMTQDSLWDSSNALPSLPSEPWSILSDSPPKSNANNVLWEPPLAATPGNDVTWVSTNDNDLWRNGKPMPTDTPLPDIVSGTPGIDPLPQESQRGTTVGGFDPFNTLGNIWNPTTSVASGTTEWSFPEKQPEEEKYKMNI